MDGNQEALSRNWYVISWAGRVEVDFAIDPYVLYDFLS